MLCIYLASPLDSLVRRVATQTNEETEVRAESLQRACEMSGQMDRGARGMLISFLYHAVSTVAVSILSLAVILVELISPKLARWTRQIVRCIVSPTARRERES